MRRARDSQRTAPWWICTPGPSPELGDLATHARGCPRAVHSAHEDYVSTLVVDGLGRIVIARPLAEAHGGTIAVQSQTGQDATFTVLLPRVPAVHPSGNAEPQQEPRR